MRQLPARPITVGGVFDPSAPLTVTWTLSCRARQSLLTATYGTRKE